MEREAAGTRTPAGRVTLTRVLALLLIAVAVGGIGVTLEHVGLTAYTAFEMSVPWALLMTAPAIVLGGTGLIPEARAVTIDPRTVVVVTWTLAAASIAGVLGVTAYPYTDAFYERFVEGRVIPMVGYEPGLLQRYPYFLVGLVLALSLVLQLRAMSRTASDAITIADPSGAPGPG